MPDPEDVLTLPLLAETLEVERRRVPTALVRVRVSTTERPAQVDETLTHEQVEVTRVAIGRTVTEVPSVREEDGVTIVPVVEEVLVVERRLVLKEEVHLRRIRVREHHHQTVMLREQNAIVEREVMQVEPSREGGVDERPIEKELMP